MKDFKAITLELKNYLKKTKTKKILDKDVAEMLEITPSHYATIKKRNVTPYKNILEFCHKEGICCREIFFKP